GFGVLVPEGSQHPSMITRRVINATRSQVSGPAWARDRITISGWHWSAPGAWSRRSGQPTTVSYRRENWSGSGRSGVPTTRLRSNQCLPGGSQVDSLIQATPPSPRWVTRSAPPKSRAGFSRGACRLIAVIRSAPGCLAASTASRPAAPSPTTVTVLPGAACTATAPNQLVPSTSEAVSRLRMRSSGDAWGGDEPAVGERDMQQLSLRAACAHILAAHARARVSGLADPAGVDGGAEGVGSDSPG